MQYQVLDWDSDFLGIKVARITQPQLDMHELSGTLSELRREKVKLVYWPSEQEFELNTRAQFRGLLVDLKTTFVVDLSSLDFTKIAHDGIVEPFTDSMSMANLEDLAIQSGEYSRFAVDPNLPKEKFASLYKTWIDRSVRKEIASEVLVIRGDRKIVAMVTLGEKNGRGDIGLLAVDTKYRGRKYGEKLVGAAQRWFIGQGYRYGQVVTQGQNIPACNLYLKCHYSVERVEYFYHFWL
jgi:dTDP-4-amino-4,6-dideoxy-D-galactose acyltransferase